MIKKINTVLIFLVVCSTLCGFVNKSESSSEFQKLPKIVIEFQIFPKPVVVEKQIIIKDLYIPKIGVNSNIYSDISYMHLGICYWRNTIIGHNNNKTGFNKLQFLQTGDILFYKNTKYILSNIKILNREQGKLIVNSNYSVILVTCHYIDNNKKRLVLFFK